jgi:hypothetical protein
MARVDRIRWELATVSSYDIGKWICIFGVFWLLSFPGQETRAQGKLVSFEKDGKWGYKNASGQVVIQPQFDMANDFSPHGIAAVVDDRGWAYVNEKGKTIIRPFVIDNGPDYFEEGLARFRIDNKFGFFDRKGEIIIEPRFDFAFPFHEGLAAICMGCQEEPEGEHRSVKDGKWGYIDKKGKVVIPTRFEEAGNFEKGKAGVKLEGEKVFIDAKGKMSKGSISGMEKEGKPSIGSARMEEDGTIVLELRGEGPKGLTGDALLRYPPGHPEYNNILRHLGGLKKGEIKQAPPWP